MAEFPKSYSPKEAEKKWYELWAGKGYFRPEVNPDGAAYSIVIPPPNVTGSLHMGHALNATLQDILVRWRRMQGQKVLWLPGTDHAGIATQNVVERKLAEEGKDRHGIGRDAFVERVWKWKEESGGKIIHQLKKLGASCDWARERFTLDEGLSRAVREVFVRLYEEGLIYRDTRLINWCPRCRTALSDLEVEHEEIEGTLTYIEYPMLDGKGSVTVATTRPETMLGDTAVAVNPEDGRHAALVGKTIELPLSGRKIPVIADTAVDPAFGTGAVKVTPAHDFNDEAVAKRQRPPLPSVAVIGEDGKMTRQAGQRYEGLDRYECRRLVLGELRDLGLVGKETPYRHQVAHCYRCKTIIEPLSTPQWYVKIAPLAAPAVEAVRRNRIRITPSGWENSYFAWMENIRDWCISRQIWWGHRIPVWYCGDCGEAIVSTGTPAACPKCEGENLRQDPDVLDTWFSSALWPFSTLGWPDETADLRTFYPTSVLVTAFDILFFWVARMIMMGLKFMNEVPFRDVYIHAIVRDAEGRKMSKSKGNVIDPLLLIDKYGADAFRFTLAAFAAQGRDIKFSEERLQGYRHFINKLWNAARFILMNRARTAPASLPELRERAGSYMKGERAAPPASRWILSRLASTVEEVNRSLSDYRFNDAAASIYQFVWHEFCDWYIEMAKTEMSEEVGDCLMYVLETSLRLLHPFMPFLTEEIRSLLPIAGAGDVAVSEYPGPLPRETSVEKEMAVVMDAVIGIRNIRGELDIPPAEKLDVSINASSPETEGVLRRNAHYIRKLANTKTLDIGTDVARPAGANASVREGFEIYVTGIGDAEAELRRLSKEKKKTEESLAFLRIKLRSEEFRTRAPKEIVEKEQRRYDEMVRKQEKLIEGMEKIRGLKR